MILISNIIYLLEALSFDSTVAQFISFQASAQRKWLTTISVLFSILEQIKESNLFQYIWVLYTYHMAEDYEDIKVYLWRVFNEMVRCLWCNQRKIEQYPKLNSWPLISDFLVSALALPYTRYGTLARYLTFLLSVFSSNTMKVIVKIIVFRIVPSIYSISINCNYYYCIFTILPSL